MYILVTGSSGLIGSALVPYLTSFGHGVIRLIRHRPRFEKDEMFWDPTRGELDPIEMKAIDAVIHLAGENIMGRWTRNKKSKIRNSRIDSTQLLTERILKMEDPPMVFICASAVGYYGNRGDEILTEPSNPGFGFLPALCQEWEESCEGLKTKGIRVVHLRTGMVLSEKGGALPKMLLPFKLGLGGPVGHGLQYVSWVALEDLLQIIVLALKNEQLSGAINAVSPHPVIQRDFAQILAKLLKTSASFKTPRWLLKLLLGSMADEVLLASCRVVPQQLLAHGFVFKYPELEPALKNILGM